MLAQLPTVTSVNTANGGLNFSSGADFVVGDTFQVSITSGVAAANQPVTLIATKNGSGGQATNWTTDANGSLNITGTQTADLVGDWTEQWLVGGLPASSFLEFEVIQVPSSLVFKGVNIVPASPQLNCPSQYVGVFGDIEYQVVPSSGTYDTAVPLTPYEDVTVASSGSEVHSNIGPPRVIPTAASLLILRGIFMTFLLVGAFSDRTHQT